MIVDFMRFSAKVASTSSEGRKKQIYQTQLRKTAEAQWRQTAKVAGGRWAYHFLGKSNDLGKPLATFFTTRIFAALRQGAPEVTLTPQSALILEAMKQFQLDPPKVDEGYKMVIRPHSITLQKNRHATTEQIYKA